jgi:hypothetical protein
MHWERMRRPAVGGERVKAVERRVGMLDRPVREERGV